MASLPSITQPLHTFQLLQAELSKSIIGQERLIQRVLITLLCHGHLIVQGAPGLAKTKVIKTLAKHIEGSFHRIQFTPDLLPADITGTDIYRPETGQFEFQQGPLFHHLILADEINRAPAKVQSALLEAMGEQQITIGQKTYPLPTLFMVMATQNSIEQEGTYPLPEAQLDRFLLFVNIDFPSLDDERKILAINRNETDHSATSEFQMSQQTLKLAQTDAMGCHLSQPVEDYLLHCVCATREPGRYHPDLKELIRSGASPRASIAFDRAIRAHAWLAERDYVSPHDVQALAHEILRHRIVPSFKAQAENIDADGIIDRILDVVAVP